MSLVSRLAVLAFAGIAIVGCAPEKPVVYYTPAYYSPTDARVMFANVETLKDTPPQTQQ